MPNIFGFVFILTTIVFYYDPASQGRKIMISFSAALLFGTAFFAVIIGSCLYGMLRDDEN